MAEILRSSQSPVTHKIFWEGEAVNADSNPVVKVYDVTEDPAIDPAINANTVLVTLTAVPDELNPGTYTVNIPFQFTDRNRTLKLKWEYSIKTYPVVRYDDVYVVTPYIDFNHIEDVGFSTDQTDPNYKTYRELVAAERYARKQIENYTGQSFYLYDDVHVVYGYGSDVLPLPAKLHSLHELYANDILLVDTLNDVNNWSYVVKTTETGYGIRVDRSQMLDNTVYVANGMIPPSIEDGVGIFKTNVPYRVQGRFGWDKVPDEVELATIELMKDYFAKDKTWRNKYISKISTFDWDFEYTDEAYSGTGNAYADRLLIDYVMVSKAEII